MTLRPDEPARRRHRRHSPTAALQSIAGEPATPPGACRPDSARRRPDGFHTTRRLGRLRPRPGGAGKPRPSRDRVAGGTPVRVRRREDGNDPRLGTETGTPKQDEAAIYGGAGGRLRALTYPLARRRRRASAAQPGQSDGQAKAARAHVRIALGGGRRGTRGGAGVVRPTESLVRGRQTARL